MNIRQMLGRKPNVRHAFSDFMLSREAMLCTPSTLEWYRYTAGFFIDWLLSNKIRMPSEIKAKHVRTYLSNLSKRGLSSNTIHCHARAIRTFVRFLYMEGYIKQPVTFAMPRLEKTQLPVLNIKEVIQILQACRSIRNKAIVLLLVDTGLRRSEACALNWGDLDLDQGTIRVRKGKGRKSRTVVVGQTSLKEIRKYRETVPHEFKDPLLQTSTGRRLSPGGLRMVLRRLSERTGVYVSSHVLRRSFATLSLRSGMDVIHLQKLMGHSTLEMTRRYTTLLEDDLIIAHNKFGPLDSALNSNRK